VDSGLPIKHEYHLTHDRRIKAAIIADPLALWFTADSLQEIKVPIQLWASELGGDGVTPHNGGCSGYSFARICPQMCARLMRNAVLRSVNVAAALAVPGVVAVCDFCDPAAEALRPYRQPLLARERLRYGPRRTSTTCRRSMRICS
jgi:hypothetical protein